MIPLIRHDTPFPPVDTALEEPNGLLCASDELTPSHVLAAYQQGIFPWFSEGEPILWWSPDPRCIIDCNEIHISRSMKRFLNKSPFEMRVNTDFEAVIAECAAPRKEETGTWILPEMIQTYCQLHQMGLAHSVECWQNNTLVGGVYGISINGVFCGESMFSRVKNASKAALIHIATALDYRYIDCQIPNDHLYSMGAKCIPRNAFIEILTS